MCSLITYGERMLNLYDVTFAEKSSAYFDRIAEDYACSPSIDKLFYICDVLMMHSFENKNFNLNYHLENLVSTVPIPEIEFNILQKIVNKENFYHFSSNMIKVFATNDSTPEWLLLHLAEETDLMLSKKFLYNTLLEHPQSTDKVKWVIYNQNSALGNSILLENLDLPYEMFELFVDRVIESEMLHKETKNVNEHFSSKVPNNELEYLVLNNHKLPRKFFFKLLETQRFSHHCFSRNYNTPTEIIDIMLDDETYMQNNDAVWLTNFYNLSLPQIKKISNISRIGYALMSNSKTPSDILFKLIEENVAESHPHGESSLNFLLYNKNVDEKLFIQILEKYEPNWREKSSFSKDILSYVHFNDDYFVENKDFLPTVFCSVLVRDTDVSDVLKDQIVSKVKKHVDGWRNHPDEWVKQLIINENNFL